MASIIINQDFYPRSPCGERLTAFCMDCQKSTYFYPRSPCGERLSMALDQYLNEQISIHALLAESDCYFCNDRSDFCFISIHALLAESDTASAFLIGSRSQFLSTLSLRRATNTHCQQNKRQQISIHALLAESDAVIAKPLCQILIFLSTLSLRRATNTPTKAYNMIVISIHALLAESDIKNIKKPLQDFNFYPRSPCGERPDQGA